MEPDAGAVWREYPVHREHVDVHVQIEGSPESLDDGHGAAAPIDDAGLSGNVAQEAKDRYRVASARVSAGAIVASTSWEDDWKE